MSRLLREGQKVQGSYEVERYLGEGAFAEVYRVRHRYLGRQAMKVFKTIGTIEETDQLLDEAIILSQLRHPNIVSVLHADTVTTSSGCSGFFTMEYVAGGSLHNFWTSYAEQLVPVDETVDLLIQICDGLAVAHGEKPPIVHRDLTPHNILVGYERDGLRARISDFGLAKRADPLHGLVSAKGALSFKAPESRRDHRKDSPAGDVWAVGTIAYLLLTDVLPFEEPGGVRSLIMNIKEPPRSPRMFNSEVDHHLERVILRALEPQPEKRLGDAAELKEELLVWRGRGTTAQPTQPNSSPTSKVALGAHAAPNSGAAGELVTKALGLARQIGTLPDAADLLEEAFNIDPALRSRYGRRVQLWRKGIAT